MAGERDGARRASASSRSASASPGQMHGLVCLDEHDRVLRPAILWNDQRTGAECAEIEERVGLERLISLTGNRALPGLHRAEAPLAAPARAGGLRAHPPHRAAEGLRPAPPHRRVGDRRRGRLRDAALRRRATGAGATTCSPALEMPRDVAPAGARVDGDRRRGRPAGGGARRRRDRAGHRLGRARHVGRRPRALPAYAHDPEARVHAFCHALPDTWEAMGVMLNAAGSLRWLRDALAPGASFEELTAEADGWSAGRGGPDLPPVPPGRADAARGPGRAWRLHRPLAPARPGSARPRRARGRRLRPARLARAPARARRRARARAACRAAARAAGSGSRSSPPCSACRSSAPSSRRARRTAPRSSPASPAGVFADAREAVAACVRPRDAVEPNPAWAAAYEEGYARFRALYPALRREET